MRAENTVTKVSREYKRFARNMAIMKNSMDRASDIYNARMEGMAEGHAEGIAEGETKKNLEIARKMKEIGISSEKIQAVTGLIIEEINSL